MVSGINFHADSLFVDGIPVQDLATEFGTPLYAYSQMKMRESVKCIGDAFHQDVKICYAVKANGLRGWLQSLAAEGCGFDLVSGGELERLVAAGLGDREFVFSGVGKEEWEIAAALARPGLLFLNVESLDELHLVAKVAAELGMIAPVALRLNLDIPVDSHAYLNTSLRQVKFGLDLSTVTKAVAITAASSSLRLEGYQVHLGSLVASPEPYLTAAKKVIDFVAQDPVRRAGVTHLDLGGGFAIPLGVGGVAFPFGDFAPAIEALIAPLGWQLVIEPGRFLVGAAGLFLTRVVRVKESGGRRFIIVDGAMNDFLRPSLYQAEHLVWPVRGTPPPVGEIPAGEMDLVGPVCESGDFLARDRELPDVVAGDVLAVFGAGAYGSSMASRYNSRRLPAEVMVVDGVPRLMKKRDSFGDLWSGEE